VSDLWDPLFGAAAVAAELDDRAFVRALCDAEAALAVALAGSGLIVDSGPVVRACAELADTLDPAELGRLAAPGGNPVIPLATLLRARAPDAHDGATSQDILDTAMMLVARRALAVIGPDLGAAADACAGLARAHRNTPMIGRTLLQRAVPTTFGALAAVWGAGLDRAVHLLANVRLAAQLGGAAGTLADWDPYGPAVVAAFARHLGLAEPPGVWHTERTRVTELATSLGVAANVVGTVATDVVLLAQTELGELREAAGGGSSAMAHKHNPIAAVTARAAAAQAPGLVATILAQAPELQRGAGPWHAEWPALLGLLRATGGAAARLRDSLAGLRVDGAAMARNLGAGSVGHAPDLVDRYLSDREAR
jgi:3-carboxy-cis,cis-muconate cycloisomerase